MSEFKLIEENVNALRLSDDTKFYDYNVFKDLVESAEEVHGLSVFSNYKVPEYSRNSFAIAIISDLRNIY